MTDEEILKTRIKEIWANLEDWGEHPTSEEGIMIVKFPISRTGQAFVGLKIKKFPNSRRGVYLKSKKEVRAFRDLLNCKKILDFFQDDILQTEILPDKEWEEIPSGIPGIGYTKIPSQRNPDGIPAVVINPVNEYGKKIKRRNLYLQNIEAYTKYRDLFNNQKIDRIIQIIGKINDELSIEFRVARLKITEKFK
jgi:hypothetical protein